MGLISIKIAPHGENCGIRNRYKPLPNMNVKPIPDDYRAVTPYLITRGAARALDFYQKAFGAREVTRFAGPEGKLMHAEIKIGSASIMLADEFPEMGVRSPEAFGGSPVIL